MSALANTSPLPRTSTESLAGDSSSTIPADLQPTRSATTAHEERVAALDAELNALRTQLGPLDAGQIVQTHIQLLHTYNEVKDAAQALIGKYALMTNRTIRDVHEELELPLSD